MTKFLCMVIICAAVGIILGNQVSKLIDAYQLQNVNKHAVEYCTASMPQVRFNGGCD